MLIIGRKPNQTACIATPDGELMTITVRSIREGVLHFVVACSHAFEFNDLMIPCKRTEGSAVVDKPIRFTFPSRRQVLMVAKTLRPEFCRLGLESEPDVTLDREEIWQRRCREAQQAAQ